MQELTADRYYRAAKLLEPIAYDTVYARAVIEQKQSGKVLVDDYQNPKIALIYHKFGSAILCGADESEAFINFAVDLLLKNTVIDQKQIRITVYPESLSRKLEGMLSSHLVKYTDFELDNGFSGEIVEKINCLSKDKIVAWTRVKFKFIKEAFISNLNSVVKPPKGMILKKIDEKLFKQITGTIVPDAFWDSAEHFHRNGIGYCLMKDDKTIASASFAAYIVNNQIDIGIETNPAYRGHGFGSLTSAAMIKYCLDNGYEPVWGCRKDNLASFRLAQKLGFKETIFHPTYWAVNINNVF